MPEPSVQTAVRASPQLVRADVTDRAAQPLLDGLAEEYRRIYGAILDDELALYEAEEFRPPHGAFLLVLVDGLTVAGGALRRLDDGVGEIKRLWTAPAHRGEGHGRRVLRELEAIAVTSGYRALRLETGDADDAAIGLYRSAGYHRIAPYGRYAADPRCVCFEKLLP